MIHFWSLFIRSRKCMRLLLSFSRFALHVISLRNNRDERDLTALKNQYCFRVEQEEMCAILLGCVWWNGQEADLDWIWAVRGRVNDVISLPAAQKYEGQYAFPSTYLHPFIVLYSITLCTPAKKAWGHLWGLNSWAQPKNVSINE